jgi:hypothetical protein
MFRINPARLVYLKFRATIASGIAGNNVPTVAIVILLSKKYFQIEFINFMRFWPKPPLTNEMSEGLLYQRRNKISIEENAISYCNYAHE